MKKFSGGTGGRNKVCSVAFHSFHIYGKKKKKNLGGDLKLSYLGGRGKSQRGEHFAWGS